MLVLLATASLSLRGRALVIQVNACVALASALLGAAQVSLGEAGPHLYAASNTGVVGFQANKNAEADVLLIGLVALAAALAPALDVGRAGARASSGRRAAWIMLAGGAVVLLFATLLTNSRMGIVLIPVAVMGAWAILAAGGVGVLGVRRPLVWLPLALMAAAGGAAVLAEVNLALGAVFSRFAVHDDFRRELWRDGWFALTRSWPSGIGVGGAEQALMAAERLEVVRPSEPNRVHNDYLEFVLEGGVLAIAVLLAGAGLAGRAAWREWRARAGDRAQIVLGCAVLAILALHSLVDYPLRSMALACLGGVAAGLLAPSPVRDPAATPLRGATG